MGASFSCWSSPIRADPDLSTNWRALIWIKGENPVVILSKVIHDHADLPTASRLRPSERILRMTETQRLPDCRALSVSIGTIKKEGMRRWDQFPARFRSASRVKARDVDMTTRREFAPSGDQAVSPWHEHDSVIRFQHRRKISSILIRNTVVPLAIRTTSGSCLATEVVKSSKTRELL
jgi:hypothetical protein